MRRSVPLLAVVAATTLALGAPQALAGPSTAATPSARGHAGGALISDATAQRLAAAAKSARHLSADATAAPADYMTVVSGLDNPRQVSADRRGQIFVAEAGHGADDKSTCVGSGEETFCAGLTGRVSRIDRTFAGVGVRRTVVRGLPSGAGPDGSFAGGSHGVDVWNNDLYIAVGEVPELTPNALKGQSAALLRARPGGPKVKLADLLAFELKYNPDGQRQFNEKGEPLDALIEHGAQAVAPRPGVLRREQQVRQDEGPLLVRHIARVRIRLRHPPAYPPASAPAQSRNTL